MRRFEMLLEIRNLSVEVQGKEMLHNINLEIDYGETHVLFGKNGSGKTSLLMTIMGMSGYKITKGNIFFKGEDISNLSINERARMGIGMSFQRPPTISGVKTRDLVQIINNNGKNTENIAKRLNVSEFLDRDVNLGFSGGEIKKSELLQLVSQNSDLVLLDEPESGVDIENIKVIGNVIKNLLQKHLRRQRVRAGLVITHTGLILNYLEADKGHILLNGRMRCEGNPREIFQTIQKFGYEECVRCQR
ncbi:MAG: ABC transporter ATP-binding protein [Deltaproteobacteria bacterium]|nr:ABC transporter ATP-binding protein [Deltaproteobacteria bacterium]